MAIEYIKIENDVLVISGSDRFFISDVRTVAKNESGNLIIDKRFILPISNDIERQKFYHCFDNFYKEKNKGLVEEFQTKLNDYDKNFVTEIKETE